jgi:hypothetical protein
LEGLLDAAWTDRPSDPFVRAQGLGEAGRSAPEPLECPVAWQTALRRLPGLEDAVVAVVSH